MHTRFVRPYYALLVIPLLAITACGPTDLVGKSKLGGIDAGMTQAQVVAIMGTGPLKATFPADSARLINGFRTQAYIVGGVTYRVLWYREAAGTLEDAITRESETPVLFAGDTVAVVGWSDFDDMAEKLNLPNPYRAAARIDSISKSQDVKQP